MTGYMAEMRKLVGHRTIMQCAASVICLDEGGRALLGRRSDNHKWGYAGGACEIDEKAEDCAKRELFCVNSGPEAHYIYPNGDEVSNFEVVFLSRKWRGVPKAADGEMEELKFFSLSEIGLEEISPPIRGVVKKLIELLEKEQFSEQK